jgi:hypothetical protein
MNYDVIIITEADFSDDPAFIYPFKANKIEDVEVGVREAIAEWRRCNPNQNFLEAGCTVLVEGDLQLFGTSRKRRVPAAATALPITEQ